MENGETVKSFEKYNLKEISVSIIGDYYLLQRNAESLSTTQYTCTDINVIQNNRFIITDSCGLKEMLFGPEVVPT